MPGMELTTGFDPRLDQLSKKIQEIRERKGAQRTETMDDAMNVVDQNTGRSEARQAEMSMQGLSEELVAHSAAVHSIDPAKIADLLSDPFED